MTTKKNLLKNDLSTFALDHRKNISEFFPMIERNVVKKTHTIREITTTHKNNC